jgi:hypothetical protein
MEITSGDEEEVGVFDENGWREEVKFGGPGRQSVMVDQASGKEPTVAIGRVAGRGWETRWCGRLGHLLPPVVNP